MSEVPISEASGHLEEVADESAATGEVIYLTRDGRRLAAIVPAEIEAAEDAADIAAAEAAMVEPGEDILAEAVWAELGIADDERPASASGLGSARQCCGNSARTARTSETPHAIARDVSAETRGARLPWS
jgi:prevent-host-death family protein